MLFSDKKNVPGFESGLFESLRSWYYCCKQLINCCHLQSSFHRSTFMRNFYVHSVRRILFRSDLVPSNTGGNLTTDFNRCRNILPNL